MEDLLGITGLALILVAWLPGAWETIKSGKPGMKKRFAAYAHQLNSLPFIILNALAAFVPLIHLYFYLRKHGPGAVLKTTDKL